MTHVIRQQDTVFVAPNGRRFLSIDAAYRQAAKLKLIEEYGECECDSSDYSTGYPGNICDLHDGSLTSELVKIMQRMKQEDREARS